MTAPHPLAALGRLGSGVRRRVLVHRRLLAALLVGLAALLSVQAVRAPAAPTVPVVTARHDLPAGTLLRPADLRRTTYPPDRVPTAAVRDPARVLGRYLAAPLRAGSPLTDLAVLGPALARADPDRVAVPVRIADTGVGSLLRVGDQVDLVAIDPDRGRQPVVVARAARVVALPRTGADDRAQGRLVVFTIFPTQTQDLLGAAAAGFLTVTLGA